MQTVVPCIKITNCDYESNQRGIVNLRNQQQFDDANAWGDDISCI